MLHLARVAAESATAAKLLLQDSAYLQCCSKVCMIHMQVRRSRQLEISFIATVVNYEYKFIWTLSQACASPDPIERPCSSLQNNAASCLTLRKHS